MSSASALSGEHVLALRSVPVFCNVLWPTRQDAVAASTGDIELVHDPVTDLVANKLHVPELVAYSPSYENSLEFSPRFRSYVDELATRVVERSGLGSGRMMEIGPGDGSFLELCCTKSGASGIGFDPSHDPSVVISRVGDWEIVAEPFPFGTSVEADLVVCRHVLEHVDAPDELLVALRSSVAESSPLLYFEVPDATYMVEAPAVWDVIYEHCWYFSEVGLTHLLERCGFEVVDSGRSFGDQYLWVEARPGPVIDRPLPSTTDFSGFAQRCRAEIDRWDQRLRELPTGATVALWGVGSKGVSFLNVVPEARRVALGVDVNPRKHGKHVPVSGQPVIGPQAIEAAGVSHVIVLNPMYEDEITASLRSSGLEVEVLV